MPTYISAEGNAEVWDEKPEGYFTNEEWLAAHPATEPEFNPGPAYERREEGWWKVCFSKKDFLLLCGLSRVLALNTAINEGNALAKTVHDLLMAAEYIDLRDAATENMIQLLTTDEAGSVLTALDAARILEGRKYDKSDL